MAALPPCPRGHEATRIVRDIDALGRTRTFYLTF